MHKKILQCLFFILLLLLIFLVLILGFSIKTGKVISDKSIGDKSYSLFLEDEKEVTSEILKTEGKQEEIKEIEINLLEEKTTLTSSAFSSETRTFDNSLLNIYSIKKNTLASNENLNKKFSYDLIFNQIENEQIPKENIEKIIFNPHEEDVSAISISGSGEVFSSSGFVRVVAIEEGGLEWLVFGSDFVFIEQETFSFNNFCEETCLFDSPKKIKELRVEYLNANLNLDKIYFQNSENKRTDFTENQLRNQRYNTKLNLIKSSNLINKKSVTFNTNEISKKLYRELKNLQYENSILRIPYDFFFYSGGVYKIKPFLEEQNTNLNIRDYVSPNYNLSKLPTTQFNFTSDPSEASVSVHRNMANPPLSVGIIPYSFNFTKGLRNNHETYVLNFSKEGYMVGWLWIYLYEDYFRMEFAPSILNVSYNGNPINYYSYLYYSNNSQDINVQFVNELINVSFVGESYNVSIFENYAFPNEINVPGSSLIRDNSTFSMKFSNLNSCLEELITIKTIQGKIYIGFEFGNINYSFNESTNTFNLTTSISSKSFIFPESFDWRERHGENWVTGLNHQGYICGSCWAFATVGAIEASTNLFFNEHLNLNLSEQELVSTCFNGGDCEGGISEYALNYVSQKGISEEECYPYLGQNSNCSEKCDNPEYVLYIGQEYFNEFYKCAREYNFKEMIINYGVVAGAYYPWTHAMALVGWEDKEESVVWIFKNSYGEDWVGGGEGYAYIEIDNDAYRSVPGLAADPVKHAIIISNQRGKLPNCVDKDNDGFCNWGISQNQPATCPLFCNEKRDCDDSNPLLARYISDSDTSNLNYNCYETMQTCVDSDGGKNYFTKGNLTFRDYSENILRIEQDSCVNKNTLREWYCGELGDPAGLLRSENYISCSKGCFNGACNKNNWRDSFIGKIKNNFE